MIIVTDYVQNGSATTIAKAKGTLSAARNAIFRFREEFISNPNRWLSYIDPFFAIADIILDLMERLVDLCIQGEQELAVRRVFYFRPETQEEKGDAVKAENIIKSLKFAHYRENNLCDLKEGISDDEYDETVDAIANWSRMPKDVRQKIKRARHSMSGRKFAADDLKFTTDDGSMVFGRVAVVRKGKTLDMAYSLNTLNYKLVSKDENAENLKQFSGSVDYEKDDTAKGESQEGISMELINDFKEYFLKRVIDGFGKHCQYILKGMNNGEDVVRGRGVNKNGGTTGEEKKNEWFLKTYYGRGKDARTKDKKDKNYTTTTHFSEFFLSSSI